MVAIIRTIEKDMARGKNRHKGFYYLLLLLLFLVAALELLALNSKFGYADSGNSNVPVDAKYKAAAADIDDKKSDKAVKIVIKEISGAPPITQMPELPSGCEAVATTMLLKWAGINVSREEVASALPKGSMPSRQNGSIYGSNPNYVFIGDPFSDSGLGVYHKPIAALVDNYIPNSVKDITGTDFKNVLKEIDGGRPVVVWATMNMAEPSLCASWYDKNGSKVKWIAPEHAFLLTGYTDNDVIVNDPYSGKRQIYPIAVFKSRWESMGSQAVTVSEIVPGSVVVTDVTNLTDVKSMLGLNSEDTTEPKAPAVKKAEQVMSEMSKPEKGEAQKQFKLYFKEIYNEVTVTIRSCYNEIIRFFNE